jgi:hypothetical protein
MKRKPGQGDVDRWIRIARVSSRISGPLLVAGSLLVGAFYSHCEIHPMQIVGLFVALPGRLAAAVAVGRCVRLWRAGVHPPYSAAALALLILLL